MIFTHYLLYTINIDRNMIDPLKTFMYLISVEKIKSKI